MKILYKTMLGVAATVLAHSCATAPSQTLSGLSRDNFISEIKGKATDLYTLTNSGGMEVCVTNLGGRIVSVMVPDRNGEMKDVLLGFDNVADFADNVNTPSDFGASVGRYANRINQGRIVIDGETIQLPQNNFGHCLHGGPEGWQYQVYDAVQPDESTVILTMESPDGDANFPGAVTAVVTMKLTDDNAIDIR
jgi:aldose 1-epimerase